MAKHKDREFGEELFQKLEKLSGQSSVCGRNKHQADEEDTTVPHELRKMKKFRFQLLHRWLVARFAPCHVADIAGGKGLLAHLLQESGWQAVVIDPHYQSLPDKYKDITTGERVKLETGASVPHLNKPFKKELAAKFDLLVGMHAHGCNIEIIDAAKAYDSEFVLLPCCVIDEPFVPRIGEHWLESLTLYAQNQGFTVMPFRLNFKGQNIGLYGMGQKRGYTSN